MGIFIKKPDTEAKIRELAARTGETLTDAIDHAVKQRLARLDAAGPQGRVDWARLAAIQAEVRALPHVNEQLTDDEIIGYDEHGVPA